MADPLVSVVLPTFNRSALLKRSLDGLFRQTFSDFEVIVVDDHSTDDTPEVLSATGDPRLRALRQDRQLGASAARNAAIECAKGRFVCFHDDDDEWFPQKLSVQLEAFSREPDPENALLYTQVVVHDGISSDVRPRSGLRPDEPLCEYLMRGQGLMLTSSIMLTRRLISANPFPPQSSRRFAKSRDLSLFLSLEAQGVRFVFLEQPLLIWHVDLGRSHLSHSSVNLEDAVAWLDDHARQVTPTARSAYLAREVAPYLDARSWAQTLRLIGSAIIDGSIPVSEAIKSLIKAFVPPRVIVALRHVLPRSRFG